MRVSDVKMLRLKRGIKIRAILPASCLIITCLVFINNVNSATTVGTLPVSANVIISCSVTTSPVNFGGVTGISTINATGNVVVNCPADVPYHITLDSGLHYSGANRQVASGSHTAGYVLRKPDFTSWGDSDYINTYPAGSSLEDTGNGADQSHTVNATLSPFSGIPAETILTDTVIVTVNY
jgi:spore coat protein U-like protein